MSMSVLSSCHFLFSIPKLSTEAIFIAQFFFRLCDRNFCFISQPVSGLFGVIFTSFLPFVVFRNMYVQNCWPEYVKEKNELDLVKIDWIQWFYSSLIAFQLVFSLQVIFMYCNPRRRGIWFVYIPRTACVCIWFPVNLEASGYHYRAADTIMQWHLKCKGK